MFGSQATRSQTIYGRLESELALTEAKQEQKGFFFRTDIVDPVQTSLTVLPYERKWIRSIRDTPTTGKPDSLPMTCISVNPPPK